MTARLRVPWPDPALFAARDGRPVRILAVSDEPEPSLDAEASRERLGEIDFVVGCGDLEPTYLSFVADAVRAPLHYVRGNHDVGSAWTASERLMVPEPLTDARVVVESGVRLLGFSGSPIYNDRGMQVSSGSMWLKSFRGWLAAHGRPPILILTHAPPRGRGDDQDLAHRGFTSFRWLAERLRPPLWLHGHTALVRRGIDDRSVEADGTLFYNVTGAALVELVPPDAHD